MSLSEHIRRLGASGTMVYFDRVTRLKQAGRQIVSLATGEPSDHAPDDVIGAAVQALHRGETRYTLNAGITELRRAIAARTTRIVGETYDEHEVLISNGSKQALYNVLCSVCGPGDEVIIIGPYYPSYPHQVRLTGAEPVIAATSEQNGFQVRAEILRSAVTQRTRAIIINSPNNPTGAVYDSGSLDAIAAIVQETGCTLLSDEIYESLVYGGHTHKNIIARRPDLRESTILVGGFSKSYAMTGFRVGYAVGPRYIIEAAALVQSHVTNNAATISQHAALAALHSGTQFPNRLRKTLERRREVALEVLAEIDGIKLMAGDGAFYCFPNVEAFLGNTGPGVSIKSSSDVALYLLEEHEVAVVPGEAFGAPGYLRLSYACEKDVLVEGLARLQKGLELLR